MLRMRDQKLARMKARLELLTSSKGVEVSPEAFQEIEEVVMERMSEIESLPTTDFRRIFWDQQVHVNVYGF